MNARHSPETKIMDTVTGVTYDIYDGDSLYDPKTDYYFEPIGNYPSEDEKTVACSDCVEINGLTYIPKRCYRDGNRLRTELATHGFDVIFQNGEFDENLICVHAGSGIDQVKLT
jgi:hypothetical protein